jgi:actin related protein 2/3 complex, subunit 2
MILLDVNNKAVYEALCIRFESALANQKPETTELIIADFDGVVYHLSNPNGDRTKLLLSICLKFYRELQEHGADQLIKREYSDYLTETEPNYNVSLLFDLTSVPENWKEVAMKASLLKRNCFASVFEKYFEFQEKGETGHKTAVINYRSDETLFVRALDDRVTVIFSTTFKGEDDIILGKVFMQEFFETRRKFQQAPQVLFSHKHPPAELNDTNAIVGDNRGYITFVLMPRHITKQNRDNTINMISMLRNYLHYHLKCSKAYMHQRMRAKTNDFLKVLNRAKPEPKNKPPEERKNFFGRTIRTT